jgi:CRISPR/Cas system-associated exonuclease Cas4 (RecB family)
MVLPYNHHKVDEAGQYFDEVVARIKEKEFAVSTPPESGICKECDLRILCHAEGLIAGSE